MNPWINLTGKKLLTDTFLRSFRFHRNSELGVQNYSLLGFTVLVNISLGCVAQMLSRSVTCYVLQRNTASIKNIGFNCVFVSVSKVNLSAQLLYVVMIKKHSSKVGGTQL